MKWSELTAELKDELIASQVRSYETLSVGYFDVHDMRCCNETPRQVELRDWMNKVGIGNIGKYYIDVASDFWVSDYDYHPTIDMNEAMKVMNRVMKSDDWNITLFVNVEYAGVTICDNKFHVYASDSYLVELERHDKDCMPDAICQAIAMALGIVKS
jgi:hypothetical protein